MFHELGINIFIIDYRGYGRSEGVPSEQGIYLDAQAAFDAATRKPGRKATWMMITPVILSR